MSDELQQLERRVGAKWVAAAAARTPEWAVPEAAFDMSAWTDMAPLPPGTPQFPREQWVSYPNRRAVALLLADRLLDFDELTDEQWTQVCMVMQYGGRERVA
jgi:hypothetical protein